ncbi:MAG: septum formation initiator family protein [Blautia sp.]|nr:septum formation initiator family protein [Blautia sp.]
MKKRRKKKLTVYDRLGMAVIYVTVLILIIIMMKQGRDLSTTIAFYQAKIESLNQEEKEERLRTTQIEKLKEFMQSDEYAEQLARERLGYVKDNEIIFVEARDQGAAGN